MRLSFAVRTALLVSFVLAASASAGTATAMRALPNPVLVFTGQEQFTANGKQMTRYRFSVDNRADYPAELFAAAPDLPPCGKNTKASRTWVDIYAQDGKRLNGFCAFLSPNDLSQIWFALEGGVTPPSWVYVELTDRKTNTKYKSNLADTTL